MLSLLAFAAPNLSAQEAEELPPLSAEVARSLLAGALDIPEGEIRIAYVIAGEKQLKQGFTSRRASVAVYLATRLEDGQRRRRCAEQIYLWTPEFGWFVELVENEGFRSYLRIWSEKQGYLEIK